MAYFLSNEAVCCSGTRVHCFAASNLGRFEPIGCNRRACGVCSRVEWSLRGSVAQAAEWLLLALGRVRLGQRPGLSTRIKCQSFPFGCPFFLPGDGGGIEALPSFCAVK